MSIRQIRFIRVRCFTELAAKNIILAGVQFSCLARYLGGWKKMRKIEDNPERRLAFAFMRHTIKSSDEEDRRR